MNVSDGAFAYFSAGDRTARRHTDLSSCSHVLCDLGNYNESNFPGGDPIRLRTIGFGTYLVGCAFDPGPEPRRLASCHTAGDRLPLSDTSRRAVQAAREMPKVQYDSCRFGSKRARKSILRLPNAP
jgi:hypothetical protein